MIHQKASRFAERLAAKLLISSSDATRLTSLQARQAEAIQNLKPLHSPRSIFGSGTLIGEACGTLCATRPLVWAPSPLYYRSHV